MQTFRKLPMTEPKMKATAERAANSKSSHRRAGEAGPGRHMVSGKARYFS